MQQAAATPVRRERRQEFRLPVSILPQPDETTCGPTCLHAVFRFWGEEEPLDAIIARGHRLEHGGTFADGIADDLAGYPAGHFVVLAGFNWVGAERLIGAILLGIVTHDANLLVIHPKDRPAPEGSAEPVRPDPI